MNIKEMNIMELLQLVDDRLRPLVGADESAVQALIEEVAASPRAAGVAPDVELEPRALLAVRLMDIEADCRVLREHLHVQLTVAARIEVKGFMGPPRPRSAPEAPDQSADPEQPASVDQPAAPHELE